MLTRSLAFDAAITAGAPETVVQCTVTKDLIPQTTIEFLPGATVTIDETQASRYTLSATVADTGTLMPKVATDPLAPYGTELWVRVGVQYEDGTTETVPAGVYPLETTASDTLGLITLTSRDRSAKVGCAGNIVPYVVPGGTSLANAIGGYLNQILPGCPTNFDSASYGVGLGPAPTIFLEGNNPWTDMQTLANNFGRELFFDACGTATLRPIPDPQTSYPVWEYFPSEANLATVGTSTFDTTQGLVNVVVVESTASTTTPVQGVAQIEDRNSPIFPDPAGFGVRSMFYQTAQLSTAQQCQETAAALLLRYSGRAETPSFSAVPHPAHEAGDVVLYQSDALGIDGACLLSSWTLQLDQLAVSAYTTRIGQSTLLGITNANQVLGNVNPATGIDIEGTAPTAAET